MHYLKNVLKPIKLVGSCLYPASPKLYSKMVEDDRKLKLYGYDVFRSGGFEFVNDSGIKKKIIQFIQDLYNYYDLI